jgi:hypothetical protein
VAEPLHAYRVFQDSGARGRLDVAQTRGLTPLVGRESEGVADLLILHTTTSFDGVETFPATKEAYHQVTCVYW